MIPQILTGSMTIKTPVSSPKKRSQVTFSHSKHFKQSCISGHHEWDLVSPVQGCGTSGCHEKLRPAPPKGKPSEDRYVMSLSGAYHKACRSCHRSYSKELEALKKKQKDTEPRSMTYTTAPVACEECHPATSGTEKSSTGTFPIPLSDITFEAPEGSEPTKSSVNFPHAVHFSFSCQSCHHTWDGSSPVKNCTTSGCHDQLEASEKTRNINAPENKQYFMAAFHKGCIKYHRNLQKKGKRLERTSAMGSNPVPKSGPIGCNECHQ
jgi:hypothetical protein